MPQLENGYTRIANEILEQLAQIKLSPTQYRIILLIWRYTYGFQRKEHELSLTFISDAINCDRRQVQRELKKLEDRKIIIQEISPGKTRTIKFNKYHEEWLGEEPTVGETDNGKTTNGEIDNGETTNRLLVKPSTVLLVKQTTKKESIKEKYKDIIMSAEEKEIIDTLATIKNYPLDREKDLEMIQRLKERYPQLDLVTSVNDWATYKLDKPLKSRDSPRSQLNNSCKKHLEWGRNLKKEPLKPKTAKKIYS